MPYLAILLVIASCAQPPVDWSDSRLRYGENNCIEGGLSGSPIKPDC